jgi:hypothetical protein
MGQVRKVLEKQFNVEILELSDSKTKHIILGRLQLLDHLLFTGFILALIVLQHFLQVALDVSLFETAAVLLSFDVLQIRLVRVSEALVLPVELVVNVTGCDCNRQVPVGQLYNVLGDCVVVHTVELRENMEVLGHLLVG